MTIETKFEPGNTVFLMRNNSITQATVVALKAFVCEQGRVMISYTLKLHGYVDPYLGEGEDRLFATVEELVKHHLNVQAT